MPRCKNYAYLVTDDKTKEAVIIDPANPKEYGEAIFEHDHPSSQRGRVLPAIKKAVDGGVKLTNIINTHQSATHKQTLPVKR